MSVATSLVIRPRRAMIMCSVLAVALLAVFVVVAVLLRTGDTGVRFQRSDQAAMVGIGILLACGVMLFAIARVRADAEGIEVRNVVITRRFAWSEVLSVSFPDGASWARLELPDDEYHAVMAVQAVDRDRAVEAVRALRKLHRAATGG
ncbi:PH domain-containing protein [Amycolatopsis tolypomycina]|uniref:PH domain-containing protein n=1 Tax=Amycolatopsis tolypomycina TaxID=208445 RepID=A0A1H4S1D3_9PSEU|nr:PH domain-containing protein [Amycolatopsis tolypomycina]SEC37661.1 PH domain-containing protein [Amycolatopsis tolypomycina]